MFKNFKKFLKFIEIFKNQIKCFLINFFATNLDSVWDWLLNNVWDLLDDFVWLWDMYFHFIRDFLLNLNVIRLVDWNFDL
jgi:hypothetical protein